MDYETTSIVLIVVVTLGLAVYDVLPATNEIDADTLSAIMHLWTGRIPCGRATSSPLTRFSIAPPRSTMRD
jgi:hypothetical protein